MDHLANPFRRTGMPHPALVDIPWPSAAADVTRRMLARCPRAAETPLRQAPGLAAQAGIAAIEVKDERGRMGLGSFKALGAANVIAHHARDGQASGRTYVTASAGNHGLSVAAGARAFGARARVFLSETVPEGFAQRLRDEGAEVVRAGAAYEESMDAAQADAEGGGGTLLSDSSWAGYTELPHLLMEGYTALMAEAAEQVKASPTHLFLQAGVGGLAAAAAAHARLAWGEAPVIVVVEPEFAPALFGSIAAGAPVATEGPVSIMGRLDCKAPSLIALKGLAREADHFLTITEQEAQTGVERAADEGLASTASGAAGLAALLAAGPVREALALDETSRAFVILSEAAEA
ncbi:PLP-dependent lyase/thiolase [Brevirhabdus pacifica]|uniref:PLP-dependent lyase/thiolase n=1 Tax=Brevirhabdus pacifica TaxID=1267768 RepID=A0A1U7DH35_9RHOB|nr:pyridoxal-phosphate dependent enzyme [Brevirhabdus pacifica]APX89245.1 PLP-dependent lyase/thiolase [Brevirhabdus pacifica]OWU76710.1 diaminopropionate ammonia-lyase [Loktanella sp. 22II-4b]